MIFSQGITVSSFYDQDPLGEDHLGLLREGETILEFRERFDWESGSEKSDVLAALGPPLYRTEFMYEEYFVWEESARYDWDLRNEQPGRFLVLNFNYSDKLDSAAVSWEKPLGAEPTTTEEFMDGVDTVVEDEDYSEDLEEDLASSSSAELQD